MPPIVKFMSGYIQGAKRANPKIKVLDQLRERPDLLDQAKCKEKALGQIEKGARVLFQVAGGCGLGALRGRQGGEGLVASASTPTSSTSARTC